LSRQDDARLHDIVEAVVAIRDHLTRGDFHDGLVYDAVRVRLIEIGEAVKGIDPNITDDAPDVPWREIARMRDHLAHRHSTLTTRSFRTSSTMTSVRSSMQCSR
jgi:uncharacterized protein with HEPN domain